MADASVGVVVPALHPAPFLEETLDGLARQTRPPDAVIVVDDGSQPPLAVDRPDVRLLRREQRGGAPAARNTALAELGTEWIAFCDADDVWGADKLAAQLAVAADADVVVGRAEIVGGDGRPTGERWPLLDPGPDLVERLYETNPILTSSVLVRAEALREVGGFDVDLPPAEDWDMWLRLARAGKRFAVAEDAVVRYRRHPGGLTADVASLARATREVHMRHADLVDAATARRAEQSDLLALQDGLIACGDWAGARAALAQAQRLGPVGRRARLRGAAAAVPGLRRALGRRDPYR